MLKHVRYKKGSNNKEKKLIIYGEKISVHHNTLNVTRCMKAIFKN